MSLLPRLRRRPHPLRLLVLTAVAACPLATPAEDAGSAPPQGLRAGLARRGVTFELLIQADHSSALAGGLGGRTVLRRPLALALDLEGEPLLAWRGARLHLGLQAHGGRHGGDLAGDTQGFDNVDAEPFRQLSELWLEQRLWRDSLRLKLGKADANVDFAHVGLGEGFLNSSAGFSPTIAGFPTYPNPAAGAVVAAHLSQRLSLAAGAYDGATLVGCHGRTGDRGLGTLWGIPDALFLVGEAETRFQLGSQPGRVAAGAWRHTAATPSAHGLRRRPASGSYLVIEQGLLRVDSSEGRSQAGLFAQLGIAEGRVSEIDRHVSLGLAWSGRWRRRGDDSAGLLVTSIRFGEAAGLRNGRHETVVEAFYELRLRPWLSLKPDLQYVLDPGGRGGRGALLATLRASVVL